MGSSENVMTHGAIYGRIPAHDHNVFYPVIRRRDGLCQNRWRTGCRRRCGRRCDRWCRRRSWCSRGCGRVAERQSYAVIVIVAAHKSQRVGKCIHSNCCPPGRARCLCPCVYQGMMSPSHVGIVPLRLLLFSLSLSRLTRLLNSDGMPPVRLLLSRFRYCRLVRLPNAAGIEPLRLLPLRNHLPYPGEVPLLQQLGRESTRSNCWRKGRGFSGWRGCPALPG